MIIQLITSLFATFFTDFYFFQIFGWEAIFSNYPQKTQVFFGTSIFILIFFLYFVAMEYSYISRKNKSHHSGD